MISARVFVEVARRSFRQTTTYRAASIAGAFTNTVFGFIQAGVLLAVFVETDGDTVNGIDAADAVAYTFVAQGLIMVVSAFGDRVISERIATGDVVTDFYRPVGFQSYWLAHYLGRASVQIVLRGAPPFVVGLIAFRSSFTIPSDPLVLAAFSASVLLAAVIAFAFWFIVQSSAFWLVDATGVINIAVLALSFFSGLLLPLAFYPEWFFRFARNTPFAAMLHLPIEVYLAESASASALAPVIARQCGWAIVLLGLGAVVIRSARHKVVVQGG